jgi:alpha-mannosidase
VYAQWPFSVTRQKTARFVVVSLSLSSSFRPLTRTSRSSWSTQLDLIARYPEHRFVASQAQQFKWLEQDYPLLFQKVRKGVQEGKFIPIGASPCASRRLSSRMRY